MKRKWNQIEIISPKLYSFKNVSIKKKFPALQKQTHTQSSHVFSVDEFLYRHLFTYSTKNTCFYIWAEKNRVSRGHYATNEISERVILHTSINRCLVTRLGKKNKEKNVCQLGEELWIQLAQRTGRGVRTKCSAMNQLKRRRNELRSSAQVAITTTTTVTKYPKKYSQMGSSLD